MVHRRDFPPDGGDPTMAKIKYVIMVLCTISVCSKVAVHTYRHFNPPAVDTTAQ